MAAGIGLPDGGTPPWAEEPWPIFTEEQVSFLEKLFPPRCLHPKETVEDHLRYAGKADLVQVLRTRVVGNPVKQGLALTPEEEEAAMDYVAMEAAMKQQT